MSWLAYALISAVAAALTAILAKLGVEGVPSTLATAIRTVVVTVFAWAMVFALSDQRAIGPMGRSATTTWSKRARTVRPSGERMPWRRMASAVT